MFNLIIVIISIALTAVLTIASVSYIGNAFSEGRDQSTYTSILNAKQQIEAAITAYTLKQPIDLIVDTTNSNRVDLSALSPAYLKSLPQVSLNGTKGEWDMYMLVDASTGNRYLEFYLTFNDIEAVDFCTYIDGLDEGIAQDDSEENLNAMFASDSVNISCTAIGGYEYTGIVMHSKNAIFQ